MAKDTNNMLTTQEELKAVAKAAGASLKRAGHEVPHTALLNALAAALNRRDWNTIKAAIEQPAVAPVAKAAAEPATPARQMVTVYRCQNCDYETRYDSDLNEVKDVRERVLPGEPMPDGECPECGAVCHACETPAEEFGDEVWAAFWTDDRVFEIDIDARPFLVQTDDQTLMTIMETGYREAECTDYVAVWMAERMPELQKAFEYLEVVNKARLKETTGFECAFGRHEFLWWMHANRRETLAVYLCGRADVSLTECANVTGSEWKWERQEPGKTPEASPYPFTTKEAAALDAYKRFDLLDQAIKLEI